MSQPVTLKILPPEISLPTETAAVLCEKVPGWTMTGHPKNFPDPDTALELAILLELANIPIRWQVPAKVSDQMDWKHTAQSYTWPESPKILALVPHWRCEPWLSRCLASLLQQSHPLTQIAVIDDASPQPPLEIIKKFPDVTLLTAPERVGPYRLIQAVIDATEYDAYLFQDADDWSSCDRLETLLRTARASGAELVGSQEIRVFESALQLQAVGYPLDVNRALSSAPGHPLLHSTSLATRSLIQRLGGFATGLQFGGDTEFLLRAHWQARIVNSPRFCYFRRKRPDSLTTAVETGLDSPARQALGRVLKQRAIANAQAAAHKQPLDLTPLQVAPPIELAHHWGPPLRWGKA